MPLANSGPIRTYKELVNYLETLAYSHIGVNSFNIGGLDEVDVQTNTDSPSRYPMVYLVPQMSTLDRNGKTIIGFSMIVADITKNLQDVQINTHNNTLMIMQDLISRILLTDWKTVEINLQAPINIIPFTEKFNNNLAGWTAEINIEMKSPFDLCSAAFKDNN